MNDRFRSAALALRSHISDTYSLLAAADDVVSLIETEVAQVESRRPEPLPHFLLVRIAKDNYDVMEAMRKGQKINAIKALRAVGIRDNAASVISLKAAKEAVEDPEVMAAFNMYANDPWANPEPPF